MYSDVEMNLVVEGLNLDLDVVILELKLNLDLDLYADFDLGLY